MTSPRNPSRQLPDRPNLRHLKDEAKVRVKAGEFAKLNEAQFAIAREYGFDSWPKLQSRVKALSADPDMRQVELYFSAVRENDVETVQKILDQFPSLVNKRTPGRGVALWPWKTHEPRLRSLATTPHTYVSCPINPDNPNDPRYTSAAIHMTRKSEMIRLLVERGADINAKGCSGDLELLDWYRVPLTIVARDNNFEMVKLLVEHGANVNYMNPDGCNSAVKTAAEHNGHHITNYLIEHGARPDIHSAALLGLIDSVRELLDDEPKLIHKRDEHDRTPLDAATLLDNFRTSEPPHDERHDAIALMLIERGAEVRLEHAAALGDFDRVRSMVEADPTLVRQVRPVRNFVPGEVTGGATFETSLAAARRRQRPQIVRYLLDHGADDPVVVDK